MSGENAIIFKETVRIGGVGSEMQGVGRLSDGRAVFVPGALPGETVEAGVTRDCGRFCEARLLSVIEPSEHRVMPACPCAALCGGCAACHMDYACSLELKRSRVYDALVRVGKCEAPEVFPTLPCPVPDRTRNKAEYAVEAAKTVRVGCRAEKSHAVIDIEDCLQQKPESVKIMRDFRQLLQNDNNASHVKYLVTRVNRAGSAHVTISVDAPIRSGAARWAEALTREDPCIKGVSLCVLQRRPTHALDGACELLSGELMLPDVLFDLKFELAPQAFFQVNPPQAEKLYSCTVQAIAGSRRILDIYCGAGTITLSAAREADYAVGVEIVAPAIENAKSNAKRNGLSDRTRFICGDAARVIPKLIGKGEKFDAVILDPPRKGADADVLNAIADARVPKIAYVSCDPGTLARDVKRLAERGYKLQWAQPVDMFPNTHHVETVVLLSKVHTPGL